MTSSNLTPEEASDPEVQFDIEADKHAAVEPKTWIIAYIDWYNYELILERVVAPSWEEAVALHTKYPFEAEGTKDWASSNAFKERCFDCDCMMNWIEV